MTDTTTVSAAELAAWRGLPPVHASLSRTRDADLATAHGIGLRSLEVPPRLGEPPGERRRMSKPSGCVLLSASGVSPLTHRPERDGLVRRERCSDDVRRLFLDHFAGADLARLATHWERVLPGAAGGTPGAATREGTKP